MDNSYANIKAGLTNYAGSLIQALNMDALDSRQQVSATLIEESINIMRNEKGKIDLYVAKPLLRGLCVILDERLKELEEYSHLEATKETIVNYETVKKILEDIIKNIKKI